MKRWSRNWIQLKLQIRGKRVELKEDKVFPRSAGLNWISVVSLKKKKKKKTIIWPVLEWIHFHFLKPQLL